MRIKLVASVGCALAVTTVSPAMSAPPDNARDQIVALAHHAMDAFNKGDVATVRTLAPVESIIDEMPPFTWRGPGTTDAWLASVDQDNTRMKDSDGFSVLGPPTYIRIEGDLAYAVFPDHFRYKRAGVQVEEDGAWTFNARRTPDGWRIIAWTYSAAAH